MTKLVCWMGSLARKRITARLIIAAVAVCGLAFRLFGLSRSLWLDEAWVANSVTARSLAGMFYYDSWLQTSPPLFLLLVRITVSSFGLTSSALRLIPLLFGLISVICMFVLARRTLAPRFALPAWTLFVLSPVAIQYSKELKQYSLELAATTTILLVCVLYLERPTIRRFRLLLATVSVGLLMSYPVAFVLPAIILVVCLADYQFGPATPALAALKWRGLVRGFILAAVGGGILLVVYLLFVSPNISSTLHSYFWTDPGARGFARVAILTRVAIANGYGLLAELPIPDQVLERRKLGGAAVGALLVMGFALACLRFGQQRRRWLELQILCAVPCLLLVICGSFSWYPMQNRTNLFLLPAVILLLISSLQLISQFVLHRFRPQWLNPLVDAVLVCVTLLVVWEGIVKEPIAELNVPLEDVASTISFLRSNVQPEDLLWVHASSSEDFKLYAKMTGWSNVPVRFGHTGWPCCPRGIPATKDSGREEDVRRDLNSGIPSNFSGKIWLLYTTRPDHWRFIGLDEPRIMDAVLRERGCLQKRTPSFHNVGVSLFDCPAPPDSVPKADTAPADRLLPAGRLPAY